MDDLYHLYDEYDSDKLQTLINKECELDSLSRDVVRKFIGLSSAKYHFEQEIITLQESIRSRLSSRDISVDEAIYLLSNEIGSLKKQNNEISKGDVKQAIIVRPSKTNNENDVTFDLVIASIGFIAGGLQFVAGAAMISTGLGAAAGALLVAHGVNNVVESGYYLLYRESYTGPVRFVYQGIGEAFGISKKNADLIYTFTDIGMSLNALLSYKLGEDDARLFRYINADLLTGLKQQGISSMSVVEIAAEFVGDINTATAQYRSY